MARVVVWGLAIALLVPHGAFAQSDTPAPGVCEFDPDHPACRGGGPGGGGGGQEVPEPMWWGPIEPVGSACSDGSPRPAYLQRLVWTAGPLEGAYVHQSHFTPTPGPGDPVPGGPPGAVFAADGYVYRTRCVSVSVTDDVWAEARRRMSPVELERDPAVRGLAGLETWVWYSGQVQVEPFRIDWVDPSTGAAWMLEARAWIGRFVWDFGDGTVAAVRADTYASAVEASGSHNDPAAMHVYEVSSGQAGYVDGFPFVFSASWQGEFRWSSDGGSTWSLPAPMSNTFTDTAAIAYDVVQIRSVITGTG